MDELAASFPGQYCAAEFRSRWEELSQGAGARQRRAGKSSGSFNALVAGNPLLTSQQLLFVKRNTYGSFHYYDDHDNGIVRAGMGGNLCVLSLADGTQLFSRSYEELLDRGCVQGVNERTAPPSDSAPLPPYARAAATSRLIQILRQGHYEVKLPPADFIKLATWVDLNLPYYGTYFGRRNLISRDQPDFCLLPTLACAQDAALGNGHNQPAAANRGPAFFGTEDKQPTP